MDELKKEPTKTTENMTFKKLLKIIKFDKDIYKCAIDENYWM